MRRPYLPVHRGLRLYAVFRLPDRSILWPSFAFGARPRTPCARHTRAAGTSRARLPQSVSRIAAGSEGGLRAQRRLCPSIPEVNKEFPGQFCVWWSRVNKIDGESPAQQRQLRRGERHRKGLPRSAENRSYFETDNRLTVS